MTTDTEDRLREILHDHFGDDKSRITTETDMVEDLGTDSLDLIEICMAVEEEFAIPEMREEELQQCKTVGDVVRLIEAQF